MDAPWYTELFGWLRVTPDEEGSGLKLAVFKGDEWRERLDWTLLLSGACTLYYRPEILTQDVAWLREHGYELHVFDCASWASEEEFHEEVSRVLGFPDYYGCNLAALNDCLAEMNVPDQGGLALQFNRFDRFAQTLPEFAWHVLDVIEGNSRLHLLFGHRLIALLHTGDPRIQFKPVGARPIRWNQREWLDGSRVSVETDERAAIRLELPET